MNKQSIRKVYKQYSSIYDKLFGSVFEKGRKDTMRNMMFNEDDAVLEIGVGTGLSLNKYPRNVNITGIDLSKEMLKKAEDKIKKYKLDRVNLRIEDAEEMTFPKSSFDKVIIMYVLSVTPNPEILLEKAFAVCKEDGEVLIVNHFSNKKILSKLLQKKHLGVIEKKLGFRIYFPLEKYTKIIENHGYSNIKIKTTNYRLSNIITIKKNKMVPLKKAV